MLFQLLWHKIDHRHQRHIIPVHYNSPLNTVDTRNNKSSVHWSKSTLSRYVLEVVKSTYHRIHVIRYTVLSFHSPHDVWALQKAINWINRIKKHNLWWSGILCKASLTLFITHRRSGDGWYCLGAVHNGEISNLFIATQAHMKGLPTKPCDHIHLLSLWYHQSILKW